MGEIQSGLQASCTELMARLLLAGLLGLALVLLTVADEEDGQVDVQDKAILGLDTNALERHGRSANPGKNGKKTRNGNKEQKKRRQTRRLKRTIKVKLETEPRKGGE